MKLMHLKLLITICTSLGLGILGIVPVVRSENGYVAGFVFFPLLILLAGVCFILFIIGVVFLFVEKKSGLYFLLAMILLPVGFFGSGFVAKHFEMGAYREDPMVPLVPEVSNIVLFTKNVTNDPINSFWQETISTNRADGRGYDHLPGIHGIGRMPAKEGHEVVEFTFLKVQRTNNVNMYIRELDLLLLSSSSLRMFRLRIIYLTKLCLRMIIGRRKK